ncbi:hypothetical protein ACRBEV_32515 [Methylobacterium phyllosphaerae]
MIGLGIASDAICVTYGIANGRVITETLGGLHGRLDVAALRTRLLNLRPSVALLCFRPNPEMNFERDVLLGTVIGVIAALRVPLEHELLSDLTGAPEGARLH